MYVYLNISGEASNSNWGSFSKRGRRSVRPRGFGGDIELLARSGTMGDGLCEVPRPGRVKETGKMRHSCAHQESEVGPRLDHPSLSRAHQIQIRRGYSNPPRVQIPQEAVEDPCNRSLAHNPKSATVESIAIRSLSDTLWKSTIPWFEMVWKWGHGLQGGASKRPVRSNRSRSTSKKTWP